MNEYILLVMKWLDDKDSVSTEELKANYADAAYASAAADAAYASAAADAADAEFWVKKYFERTGENKQDYINELNKELNAMVKPKFEEVTYEGSVFQMSKIYACSVTGRIGTLRAFDKSKRYPFVLSIKVELGTETIHCVGLILVSECGTITEAPVLLIDGKAYQFEYKGDEYIGICYTSEKHGSTHVMLESPVDNAKTNSKYCTNIKLLGVVKS